MAFVKSKQENGKRAEETEKKNKNLQKDDSNSMHLLYIQFHTNLEIVRGTDWRSSFRINQKSRWSVVDEYQPYF